MKRFLIVLLLFFIQNSMHVNAIEEVVLEIDDGPEFEERLNSSSSELTFFEKIDKIKSREVTDLNKSHYLLHEILTKRFEKSPVKSMQLYGIFRSNMDIDFYPDDTDTTYGFNDLNVGVKGDFRDDKTFYEARLRLHLRMRLFS